MFSSTWSWETDIKCFIHPTYEQIQQTKNKLPLTASRLITTLFLLNTANVQQIHRKIQTKEREEPTYFPGIFKILLH